MLETWRDIEGYEGIYQVSDMGNVRNIKYNRPLKPMLDSDGYLQVDLYRKGKGKRFKVHRLVAAAFTPNPDNKPTVDHINTIRTDNRACNLRWFTQREQMLENEITKERCILVTKKVRCITTGEVFNSAADAARHYNIKNINRVSNAANPNDRHKTCGKLPDGTPLKWEYIEDETE